MLAVLVGLALVVDHLCREADQRDAGSGSS